MVLLRGFYYIVNVRCFTNCKQQTHTLFTVLPLGESEGVFIMKQIKVLVSSCACNQKFFSLVEKVVKDNQIDATVEKVDDIMEVMQYNVMSLPAIVVDGQVVARGQKNEAEIYALLK